MKSTLLKILIVALVSLIFQACGEDKPTPTPPKTAEQLATEALTGTGTQNWGIAGGGSVTKNGALVTDLYSTFELTLTAGTTKTYSTKNNNDLFDNSGNWSFAGTNFDKFLLTGSKPVAGREISFTRTGDNLRLEFTIPLPGARLNGTMAVAGTYVFTLLKK
jgi:hypothetical protein